MIIYIYCLFTYLCAVSQHTYAGPGRVVRFGLKSTTKTASAIIHIDNNTYQERIKIKRLSEHAAYFVLRALCVSNTRIKMHTTCTAVRPKLIACNICCTANILISSFIKKSRW